VDIARNREGVRRGHRPTVQNSNGRMPGHSASTKPSKTRFCFHFAGLHHPSLLATRRVLDTTPFPPLSLSLPPPLPLPLLCSTFTRTRHTPCPLHPTHSEYFSPTHFGETKPTTRVLFGWKEPDSKGMQFARFTTPRRWGERCCCHHEHMQGARQWDYGSPLTSIRRSE
jgi:hypothetical protein